MPAAFNQHYVKGLEGKKVKTGKNKCDLANQFATTLPNSRPRLTVR
jgi:myo-inositol-1-phosphate synthase